MSMPKRQEAFRADYREKLSRWYSGSGHVFLIYAIGLAGIFYFTRQIHDVRWYEWLTIPVAFAIASWFEWWIHKYVMHSPIKGFMGIYKRHTLAHHQFFTEHEPSVDSNRDFRIVFFPPYALAAFMTGTAVPAMLLNWAGSPTSAGCCSPPTRRST